jgi:magnesium-transporting ATPase (P-type)
MDKPKDLYQQHMDMVITEGLRLWETRRNAQGYNPEHKKTKELQLEFMLGVIGILDHIRNDDKSCVPPQIWFSAIRGDYIK